MAAEEIDEVLLGELEYPIQFFGYSNRAVYDMRKKLLSNFFFTQKSLRKIDFMRKIHFSRLFHVNSCFSLQ